MPETPEPPWLITDRLKWNRPWLAITTRLVAHKLYFFPTSSGAITAEMQVIRPIATSDILVGALWA